MRILHMKALSGGLLLAASLCIIGCGTNQSSHDDLPPSRPQWIARSADSTYPQTGVRAEPVTSLTQHWVHVQWRANPDEDAVAGYRIYRAAEHDPVHRYVVRDLRLDIDLPRGQDSYDWIDEGDSTGSSGNGNMLAPDEESGDSRGYYWSVRAYDEGNNVSEFSEPQYYRLISNPFALTVGRQEANLYALSWQFSPSTETDRPSYYAVRVYSQSGGPADVAYFHIERRYGSSETLSMDLSAPVHPLTPGQIYVCQLNAISDRRNADHTDTLAGAATYTTFTYSN
jgi:hypothetical protein